MTLRTLFSLCNSFAREQSSEHRNTAYRGSKSNNRKKASYVSFGVLNVLATTSNLHCGVLLEKSVLSDLFGIEGEIKMTVSMSCPTCGLREMHVVNQAESVWKCNACDGEEYRLPNGTFTQFTRVLRSLDKSSKDDHLDRAASHPWPWEK